MSQSLTCHSKHCMSGRAAFDGRSQGNFSCLHVPLTTKVLFLQASPPSPHLKEHLGAHLCSLASSSRSPFSFSHPTSWHAVQPHSKSSSSWASSQHPSCTAATAERKQDSWLASPPRPPFHPSWLPSPFPRQPGCPPLSWATPKVWWPMPRLGNVSSLSQLSASAATEQHSSTSPVTSCWQPSRMMMTQ